MNKPIPPPGEQMFSARVGLGAGPMSRFVLTDRHIHLFALPVDHGRHFGRDGT